MTFQRYYLISDDGKTDLLIIHHECDAGDVGGILTALKGRHNYSSSVYPLQSRSEIGEDQSEEHFFLGDNRKSHLFR